MSGFWTLKLGKNKQDKQESSSNNGRITSNDNGSYEIVRSLMERALDDAEQLVEAIMLRATKESSLDLPSDVSKTEETAKSSVNDTVQQSEPEAETIQTIKPVSSYQAEDDKTEGKSKSSDFGSLNKYSLYSDDVELAIAAPVEPAAVSKLYNNLQMTPEIKIMYAAGSWNKGTAITVSLEKPMPLLDIISGIKGLTIKVLDLPNSNNGNKSANTLLANGKRKLPRIDLQITTKR